MMDVMATGVSSGDGELRSTAREIARIARLECNERLNQAMERMDLARKAQNASTVREELENVCDRIIACRERLVTAARGRGKYANGTFDALHRVAEAVSFASIQLDGEEHIASGQAIVYFQDAIDALVDADIMVFKN
jgi:hypothetical protein